MASCPSGEDVIVHFTEANAVCLGHVINPDSFPETIPT